MATAQIIRRSTLTGAITQANLVSAIDSALVAVGFGSPVYSAGAVGGTISRIYTKVHNASTKGTTFMLWSLNASLNLTWQIGESANLTTGVVGNSSQQLNTIFTTTGDVDIYTVDHPEFYGVTMRQAGNFRGPLAIIRPANVPSNWDENTWSRSMIGLSASGQYRTVAPGPFNSLTSVVPLLQQVTVLNVLTGNQDVVVGPPLGVTTGGYLCSFSSDVVTHGFPRAPVTSAEIVGGETYYQVSILLYLKGVLTP